MINVSSFIHNKGGYNSDMLNDKPVKKMRDEFAQFFDETINMELKSDHISEAMSKSFKNNIFVFSACKTETQLREVGALLINEDGTVKPRAQFMREVKEKYAGYYEPYLEAEYNYAVSASQAAGKWANYAADGDNFDLQYRTSQDDHVRESHAQLHNITLPIEDPFWDKYFIPNGWGCRCTVVQVRKGKYKTSDSAESIKLGEAATNQTNNAGVNKAAIFRYNPGKEAIIFPPHHPYFKALDKAKIDKLK